MSEHFRVAIVGTGFSGLGMAIRLKQAGREDFVVLERADAIGGTWRDNTYPGCRGDVPSHLYSFSFAPNPHWSTSFSPQPEIQAYLERCAERYGVLPHVRLRHELLEASWDDAASRWIVETGAGTITADVLVSGVGGLSEPLIPRMPGLERFQGTTFHSAAWDHDHDLAGERVAVVGTGASAIQFVPEIQPRVGRLHVFQRTPPWIMPRRDRPLTAAEHRLFRRVPLAQRAARAAMYWARELLVLGFRHPKAMQRVLEPMALAHLRRQVPDRELRRKLTPAYTIGCKRILVSSDYLPALSQPNVEVVTDRIAEVRERSIVTADGAEREVDTIIFGTGFHVTDIPVQWRLRGRDGRLLADHWSATMQANRGITVAGFPNLFFLLGPNTGLGHTSIVFMIESQIGYVMDALRALDRERAASVEVRREVQEAFVRRLEEDSAGTVWTSGGCASYYLDAGGRNATLWPGFTWRYRLETRRFEPAEHVLRGRWGHRDRQAAAAPRLVER